MPSSSPLLLRNARLFGIDPFPSGHTADLLFYEGELSFLTENSAHNEEWEVMESADLCIVPGFTDLFADYREPGYESKETIATGLAAAEAGGFTQVCLVPGTLPAVSSRSMVEAVLGKAAASGSAVKLLPLGAVTKDLDGSGLAEMLDMRAGGAVAFTDGWKPVQNPQLMLKALEYVKSFDGLLIQMPVDAALSSGSLMHEGEWSTRLGMPGAPAIAEEIFLHRDIELLRYTNSRLHITGISTEGSVELIRRAKADGLHITASVSPYHLLLTDAALEQYDSHYKVTPPLRTEEDRQALINGLKDDTIDAIASHHRPQDWDSKTREFEYAGEGMALQQWMFPLLLTHLGESLGLQTILQKLSAGPASVLGQAQPTGYTIFDPGLSCGAVSHSLAFNSPFSTSDLSGRVLRIAR